MRRALAVSVLALLLLASCSSEDPSSATDAPDVAFVPGALTAATLTADDLPDGWEVADDPAPSTIQYGGRVGPANIASPEQEITVAFREDGGSGYVSNSVFLLESVDLARAVMLAHTRSDAEKWTQERQDGGGASFRRTGEIDGLATLADEVATAAINSEVTDADGAVTKRRIGYVAYRMDRIVAFVIAQDADVAPLARRQAERVDRLVS